MRRPCRWSFAFNWLSNRLETILNTCKTTNQRLSVLLWLASDEEIFKSTSEVSSWIRTKFLEEPALVIKPGHQLDRADASSLLHLTQALYDEVVIEKYVDDLVF